MLKIVESTVKLSEIREAVNERHGHQNLVVLNNIINSGPSTQYLGADGQYHEVHILFDVEDFLNMFDVGGGNITAENVGGLLRLNTVNSFAAQTDGKVVGSVGAEEAVANKQVNVEIIEVDVNTGEISDGQIKYLRSGSGLAVGFDGEAIVFGLLPNEAPFVDLEPKFLKNSAFNKDFDTSNQFENSTKVIGDKDTRLSDARPADGGNADTVDGKHAVDFATSEQGSKADSALQTETDPTVPAWAKQIELRSEDVPNLTAEKLTSGYLDPNRIEDGSITDAKLDVPKVNEKPDGVNPLISPVTVKLNPVYYASGTNILKGQWDASANIPALAAIPTASQVGWIYDVTVAGLFQGLDFEVGDQIKGYEGYWGKIDNTDKIRSVNGKTGTVVLKASDIVADEAPVDPTDITNKSYVDGLHSSITELEINALFS